MRTVYKAKKQEIDRKYHQRIKKEIFVLLGDRCAICGYSGLALQVDHVNNDGAFERKKINSGSSRYWKNILDKIKEGSNEYQLLCANCNTEKELKRRGYRP